MSNMSPTEMAQILAKGLLSFPVTHFDQDFRFQEGPYREHCAWLLSFKRLTGLFAAGGTGEFFSLTPSEVETVVTAAVTTVSTSDGVREKNSPVPPAANSPVRRLKLKSQAQCSR